VSAFVDDPDDITCRIYTGSGDQSATGRSFDLRSVVEVFELSNGPQYVLRVADPNPVIFWLTFCAFVVDIGISRMSLHPEHSKQAVDLVERG
jgi:hypothetical protein